MLNLLKKNGGILSIFVTVLICILVFALFLIYLLKTEVFVLKSSIKPSESNEPIQVTPEVVFSFDDYVGKINGIKLKKLIEKTIEKNETDGNISIIISEEKVKEAEVKKELAIIELIKKEGIASSAEYTAISETLEYFVYIEKNENSVVEKIFVVKLINE